MSQPTAPGREPPQRPPGTPPAPSLAFLVIALGRHARGIVERHLAERGMTMRHLSALGHLRREPGLSYSELGRRAGVTAQSMQSTVLQLETLGAVRRTTPPGRGRRAELAVTELGEGLLAHGAHAMADADTQLAGSLTDDEITTVTSALFRAFTATRANFDHP